MAEKKDKKSQEESILSPLQLKITKQVLIGPVTEISIFESRKIYENYQNNSGDNDDNSGSSGEI
jgi:hypothetical protein